MIIGKELYNGFVELAEESLMNTGFAMVKTHNNPSPVLVFDFGRKSTGFLVIDFLLSENTNVIIEYGPTIDSMFFTEELELPQHVENQQIVMEPFFAMRYMRLYIKEHGILPNHASMKVRSVRLKNSAYPIDGVRRFVSNEPRLNSIWETGVYTTQICLQRHDQSFCYRQFLNEKQRFFLEHWTNPYSPYVIWDGPRRDREVWIGDVRTEALTTLYSMHVSSVVKSSLQVFADQQLRDGNIPASATSGQMFTEYTFWWVITLAEYLRYSGDHDFFISIAPVYQDILGWIDMKMHHTDFISVEVTWMWTLGLKGKVGEAQCVLYRCYEEIVWIQNMYLEGQNSSRYRKKADLLKERINTVFWDEELGVYHDRLFADKEINNLVFLDLNVYAITLGIADQNKAVSALKYIKEHMWTPWGTKTYVGSRTPAPDKWGHDDTVWPFIVGYELEALFQYDMTEDAFSLIESCWGTMLDRGATTYWEFKDDKGEFPTRSMIKNPLGDSMCSYSHGWSGWVSYIMQRYICGLQPAASGLQVMMLDPHLGRLTSCNGSVETCEGTVSVEYTVDKGILTIDYTKPQSVVLYLRYDYIAARYDDVLIGGKSILLVQTEELSVFDHPRKTFTVIPLGGPADVRDV